MPTGREITKELTKFVHNRYNLAIADFVDSIDNDLISTDQAIALLNAEVAVPLRIQQLLDCFLEINVGTQFMVDNFPVHDRIEILDFQTPELVKRNRAFSISDLQFGYLSLKRFLKHTPLTDITSDVEGYRTLIDFIGTSIALPEIQLLTNLFVAIEANDSNKGLLVHKFVHTHSSVSIYSYLYYQELIQGGRIELDIILNYTGNHGATTTFNNVIVYQQYFELFDIISELNHATEIITRFLKLYHILEYLSYRVELVKMEIKARTNRSFIREIHSLTGKKSDEWEVFRKNFSSIFAVEIAANYFNLGALSVGQQTFFKNYLDLNTYTPTDATNVCKLIYRLRNSIVHNKESEFHMTMTNPDDYFDIIPLVNLLIEKLERIVYDKISNDFNQISYQSQAIELY